MNSWLALELLSGALLALALGASRLELSRSAALRHALIASSLLAALVLPLALWSPKTVEISSPWLRAAPERLPERPQSWTPEGTQLSERLAPAQATAQSAAAQKISQETPAPGVATPSANTSVQRWLMAIYLLGLAIALIRVALSVVAAQKLIREATALEPGSAWHEAARLLERDEPRLGSLVSLDSLRTSASVRFPATCGFLRPVIVVPSCSRSEWCLDRCQAVLTHELEHIRRRDWLLNLIGQLSCAVHWCNPMAWSAWREMRELAEEACDDAVVVRGFGARGYARDLVEVARTSRTLTPRRPTTSALAISVMGSIMGPLGLPRRIDRLTNFDLERSPLTRPVAISIFLFVLSASLTLGSVRLVHASELQPADDSRSGDEQDEAFENAIRAAELGNLERVRALSGGEVSDLEGEPITVNRLSPGDGTLLIAAARRGHLDVVKDLLGRGADPNLVSEGDGSPLLVAAERGDLEMMRLLSEHQADVDLEAPGDGNPLIAAARAGQLDSVAWLLGEGADVDRVVLGDETPLIQAADQGHLDVVTLLLEHGADPNLTVTHDTGGRPLQDGPRSPLSVARRGGFGDIVNLLKEHGAQ